MTVTDVRAVDVIVSGGTDGSDTISGSAREDRIDGGAGNDLIDLSQGDDDIASGGAGNDILFYGGALTAADLNDGGDGTDTLVLQGNYPALVLAASSLVSVEGLAPGRCRHARGQDGAAPTITRSSGRVEHRPGSNCASTAVARRGRGLRLRRLRRDGRRQVPRLWRLRRRPAHRRGRQRHLLLRGGPVRLGRPGRRRRRQRRRGDQWSAGRGRRARRDDRGGQSRRHRGLVGQRPLCERPERPAVLCADDRERQHRRGGEADRQRQLVGSVAVAEHRRRCGRRRLAQSDRRRGRGPACGRRQRRRRLWRRRRRPAHRRQRRRPLPIPLDVRLGGRGGGPHSRLRSRHGQDRPFPDRRDRRRDRRSVVQLRRHCRLYGCSGQLRFEQITATPSYRATSTANGAADFLIQLDGSLRSAQRISTCEGAGLRLPRRDHGPFLSRTARREAGLRQLHPARRGSP